MRHKNYNLIIVMSLFATVFFLFGLVNSTFAHDVSGTIFRNDGITPVTDADIAVQVVTGDPCGAWQVIASTTVTEGGDGSYTITGVNDGDYYLHTSRQDDSSYANEWWTGEALDPSGSTCVGVPLFSVSGGNKPGMDFVLNRVPEIVGGYGASVFDDNGTPYLRFSIAVRDNDNVTPGSHTVTVTYPDDPPTQRTLVYHQGFNMYWGDHRQALFFLDVPTSTFDSGTYHFEVSDGSDTVTKDNELSPNRLTSYPQLSVPVGGSTAGSTTPTLTWSAATEAVRYRVQILIPENTTNIHRRVYEAWTTGTSHTVSADVLAPGATYMWLVEAYREASSVGSWNISNYSRGAIETFKTTVDDPVNYSLAGLKVYHRVREDGRAYNAFGFRLVDGSGNRPDVDVLSKVQLFDSETGGSEVPISHVGFWSDEWELNGSYNDPPGEFTFDLAFSDATSYGGVVQANLVDGTTYRLEVTDISGNFSSYLFNFGTQEVIPIVPEESIDCGWIGSGDLICTWSQPAIPGGVTAHTKFNLVGLDENWNNIGYYIHAADIPPDVTAVTVPYDRIQLLKTSGYAVRAVVNIQVWTDDNSNRTDSDFTDFDLYGDSVSGTVTASGGSPIADLWVEAYEGPCWTNWLGGAETNSNGEYLIGGLSPGSDVYVRACAECDDLLFVDQWWNNIEDDNCQNATAVMVPAAGGENQPGVDFELQPATTITGRVTDNLDNPIVNLHVYANSGSCEGSWAAGDNTDANGNYTLIVPEGAYVVRACPECSTPPHEVIQEWWSADGGKQNCNDDDVVSPTIAVPATGIDFVLDPGETISGTVTADGNLLDNLAVYATSTSCGWGINYWSNTDGDGNYTIVVPPGADYFIQACPGCSGHAYVNEWWNGPDPAGQGTPECNGAVSIPVPDLESPVEGINFALDGPGENPVLRANISHDAVEGYGFPFNDMVTLSLNGGGGVQILTDDSGYFSTYNEPSWEGMQVNPGDAISVTHAGTGSPTQMDARDVQAVADSGADTVDGTAFIYQGGALNDRAVHLSVYAQDWGAPLISADDIADGSGVFGFTLAPFELASDQNIEVTVWDGIDGSTNGHSTVAMAATPTLDADVGNNWISGLNFPPNSSIPVTIDGGDPVDAPTDEWGNFFIDVWSNFNEYQLQPGNLIVATHPLAGDVSLTLQDLTATVDTVVNQVQGAALDSGSGALSGWTVRLYVWSQDWSTLLYEDETVTDGSGDFLFAINPVDHQLAAGQQVELRLMNAFGNSTVYFPYNAIPVLRAHLRYNTIEGEGFPANSTVDLSVDSGAPPLWTAQVNTDGGGGFATYWDSVDPDPVLAPGHFIEATYTGGSTSMMVQDLTGVADPSAETVSGMALAPDGPPQTPLSSHAILVEVFPQDWGNWIAQEDGLVLGDGSYSFVLTAFDLQKGQNVRVTVWDATDGSMSGHQTITAPYNQIPYLRAHIYGNWIDGWDWPPDSSVNMTINTSQPVPVPVDHWGNINIDPWNDLNGYQLRMGDDIDVNDGAGNGAFMTVQKLHARVDVSQNIVSGLALDAHTMDPLDPQDLSIWIWDDWNNLVDQQNLAVQADGTFSVNFNPLDLNHSHRVEVTVHDSIDGSMTGNQTGNWATLPGDVNIDQIVDLNDAIMILQVMAGQQPSPMDVWADVNADGRIGAEDVLYILQYLSTLRSDGGGGGDVN